MEPSATRRISDMPCPSYGSAGRRRRRSAVGPLRDARNRTAPPHELIYLVLRFGEPRARQKCHLVALGKALGHLDTIEIRKPRCHACREPAVTPSDHDPVLSAEARRRIGAWSALRLCTPDLRGQLLLRAAKQPGGRREIAIGA